MGFLKPKFPAVEPAEFLSKPLMERVRILALSWVENGASAPRIVHMIYIAKLVAFYAFGGLLMGTCRSGLAGSTRPLSFRAPM